ncbi:protein sip-5 [Luteimonas salinilitoris]|uniref:Protein sip-5 n=1 Tax=Luteimonas salinilitoris TaxID=3237697 RepID=A0ABV4HTX5_9GAMM
MKLAVLKRRVERGEQLVEGRLQQTRDEYGALRSQWREAWTPTRILVAGVVSGFVAGSSQPKQALRRLGKLGKVVGDPRWLRLISSVAGLLGSIQAMVATATARKAAETADTAAEEAAETAEDAGAGGTAPPPGGSGSGGAPAGADAPAASAEPEAVPPSDRRKPDQRWDTQPSPAEAATEMSER